MNCNKCGATVPDGTKFCPSCGANVNAPASSYAPSAPGQQSTTSGIVSLILGIAGIIMIFPLITFWLGIILGIVAMVMGSKTRRTGDVFARVGWGLGLGALIANIIILVLGIIGLTFAFSMGMSGLAGMAGMLELFEMLD